MIQRDKFLDYLKDQLGTKFQSWIDEDSFDDLSNRVIHIARAEDIIVRMLHQIIANAAQCCAMRGGIKIARTEADKNRSENFQGFPAVGELSAKGSVIEGTGKEGAKPIYMSDLGAFGQRHPWFITNKDNFAAQKARTFLLKVEGWIFSPFLGQEQASNDPNHDYIEMQGEGDEARPVFYEEIDFYPGQVIPKAEWENVVTTHDQQVRFFAKPAEPPAWFIAGYPNANEAAEAWEKQTGSVYNIGTFFQHLGVDFTKTQRLIRATKQGEDIDTFLMYGKYVEAKMDGTLIYPDSEFYPGLEGYEHKNRDHSGKFYDDSITAMEARILGRANATPSLPRSTVMPGQNATMPRVSPMTPTRPIPTTWRTLCEIKTPTTCSTDLLVLLQAMLSSITIYETAIATEVETQPALKKLVDEAKKGFVECFEITTAHLEGFLFGYDVADKLSEKAFDTNDKAPRVSTRKYSRKNTKGGAKK